MLFWLNLNSGVEKISCVELRLVQIFADRVLRAKRRGKTGWLICIGCAEAF
jgi:hypothetical protein